MTFIILVNRKSRKSCLVGILFRQVNLVALTDYNSEEQIRDKNISNLEGQKDSLRDIFLLP